MPDSIIRVLLVDDEESLRQPLANWLANEYGYQVETAADGPEAINILTQQPCFDVVLLDYLLPAPYNGLTLMEEFKHHCPEGETAFIIFTGWGLDPQIGVKALKSGAYRYLAKPFDREELAILIQSIVETQRTREKLAVTSHERALLASLLEVSQSINSTLELNGVLDLILEEMKRVVPYDSASIQTITPVGLQVIACQGFAQSEYLIGHVFAPGAGLPNYLVLQTQKSHIEGDMYLTYQSRHVRGWLGVPLICRGEALGVITLDSHLPNFYTEDHAKAATIFANQAAIAIKNAGLFSETQRRIEDLNKVHRVSQAIVSYLDVHQVLKEVVNLAAEVAASDNTSVVLADDAGQLLDSVETITAAYRYIPPLHERARLNGKTHQVLSTGQPLIVNHIAQGDDHNPYLIRAGVTSYIGLPLKAKGKVVGVLFVHSFLPNAFSPERIALLTTFANNAAVAIENARLYDQAFRRAETLGALLTVQQDLTRHITTHSKILLEKIARTACQMTGADCAVIYPYLAEIGKYDLTNLASFNLYGDLTYQDKHRLTHGEGVSSWVLRDGRVIIFDAAQDDPRLLEHNFIKRERIEAFVGIRLDTVDPVGILFMSYRRPHHWTDDELALINLFASQAATAIMNARLFGRTSEQLERKVALLRTVGEINQSITATLDLNVVLSLILSKAMELLKVQNGALQLIDEPTGELIIKLNQGPLLVSFTEARLKVGEGITGKAAQEQRSWIVEDVTQSPWLEIYRKFRPNTRSELVVPLIIGEQCLGVLNFEHPEPNYFNEDQREIIEALAAQAAIAIQNAQRYQELERTKGDLIATEAVAWIGLFGSTWAHSVAQKTAAARNYLAVLNDYLPDMPEAHNLLNKVDGMMRTIQSIPIVQKLPRKPQPTTTLDVDTALKEQICRWGRAYPQVELIFNLNCSSVRTYIDKDWLDVAMEKLINNALEAMHQGGQLKINSNPRHDQVEITITDTGPGLLPQVRPYFLKQQIPQEFTRGSGIGVLIARYIFRYFGGDIELLWSEPQRGTSMRVTLLARPITAPLTPVKAAPYCPS